jgi:catechol 2,3-dioxygenase-like lactoylglutathione lyase family enzyme
VAYRFLLEVPNSLVEESKIVVGAAGDAEVVLVRNSHSGGFDDPAADLTVAAHTLLVIETIYDWYEAQRSASPIHLMLHSGQRLNLADHNRRSMIAAIRRDQPWVEHSIPKIGDHSRDVLPADRDQSGLKDAQPAPGAGDRFAAGQPLVTASKAITFLSQVRTAIRVTDLDRAERFYADFLGLHLLGRVREDKLGELHQVEDDYNHARALAQGTEADISYLASGPVEVQLERVGRGARLARDGGAPTSVEVDRASFLQLKGDAFMRGMEIVLDRPDLFAVRDIYGLIWQFRATADVPALT